MFLNCETKNKKHNAFDNQKIIVDSSAFIQKKEPIYLKENKILKNNYNFTKLLNSLDNIMHTGNKHKDWFSKSNILKPLLGLEFNDFFTETTSYEYKKKIFFMSIH